jgi:hypothetical protein
VDTSEEGKTYLHLPGSVTSHPLSIYPNRPLYITIESDGAKVHSVGENRVPEQVFNTVKGVTVEEEHWLLCGVSSEGNLLNFPLRHSWQYLNTTS